MAKGGPAWAPKHPGQEYVDALPLTTTPEEKAAATRYIKRQAKRKGWAPNETRAIMRLLGVDNGQK